MRALTSFTTRSAIMRSRSRQLEAGQRLGGLADRHVADLGDRVAVDRDRERQRREAGAGAGRARHLAHVALDLLPGVVALGLRVAALEVGHHAFEGGGVGPDPAVAVLVPHLHLAHAGAVEERLLLLLGELRPGLVDVGAELLGHRLDHPLEVLAAGARPGREGALGEREVLVRDDELGVDLEAGAEAVAGLAGAVGRVEREVARRQLLEGAVPVGAGEVLGEGERVVGLAVLGAADALAVAPDELHLGHAVGQPQGRLEGVGEPPLEARRAPRAGRRPPRWCAARSEPGRPCR